MNHDKCLYKCDDCAQYNHTELIWGIAVGLILAMLMWTFGFS